MLPVIAAIGMITCQAPTRFGHELTLTLGGDAARVKVVRADGAVEHEASFAGVTDQWDGHMTGLVTAPGLSVKYENHYGCIRNVTVTTNVRGGGIGFIEQIAIPGCKGGTTPDDLCFQRD